MKPNRETNMIFQFTFQGKLEELKDLVINNGEDVNAIDPTTKLRPIHFATLGCQPEVIKFLLSQKADINERVEDNGFTPLHIASRESGDLFIASKLTTIRRGGTELIIPTLGGYINVATLLLEKGADIEAQDKNGMTPLHLAAQCGNVEMFKLLLEKGADVNAQDKCRITPTHFAARNGNVEVIKLLVEKGAKVNAQDEFGFTPLHIASKNGKFKTAKALLRLGADIEAADINGMTPLLIAAQQGNVEMFQLLLEKGANIEAADINGMRITHFAAQNGNVEIFKFIPKIVSPSEDIPSETLNPRGENDKNLAGTSKNKVSEK